MRSERDGWTRLPIGAVTSEVTERLGNAEVAGRVYGVDRALGLTMAAKYAADDLSRYKRVCPGTFVYNPMRLNIGSIGYCSRTHEPGLASPDYVVFRCNDGQLDPDFLKYVVKGSDWRAWTEAAGVGSVRVRIYYRELCRMLVTLPPFVEQQAIAATLGAVDDKIELNRRLNETLEAMARAIFKSWFVDFDPVRAKAEGRDSSLAKALAALFPDSFEDSELGEIPRGWGVGPLDSALVLQRGFDLPATLRTPGLYPVLAASGPSGTHNEFMVRGPGVTTGRSGVLGKVFYVDGDFWPLNTSLWVKEFRHSRPAYAFHLLRNCRLGSFNAGSAVPTLNRNHVSTLLTLLPPMTIVDAFERIAVSALQYQRHIAEESETLAAIRDALLPKLLSGEVRVKEVEKVLTVTTASP